MPGTRRKCSSFRSLLTPRKPVNVGYVHSNSIAVIIVTWALPYRHVNCLLTISCIFDRATADAICTPGYISVFLRRLCYNSQLCIIGRYFPCFTAIAGQPASAVIPSPTGPSEIFSSQIPKLQICSICQHHPKSKNIEGNILDTKYTCPLQIPMKSNSCQRLKFIVKICKNTWQRIF